MFIKAKRNIHSAVDLPGGVIFHIEGKEVRKVDKKVGRLLLTKWPEIFEEVLKSKQPYTSSVKEQINFKTTSFLDLEDFKTI